MKRTYPKRIDEIINQALSENGTQNTFNEHRACDLWPDIVGPGINRYTTRRFVESGVLHVFISSAALKNELQFMRSRIVEELNRAVGVEVINSIIIH